MLDLVCITTGYGRLQVLFDVTLSVLKGEAVALIGLNGAGKSTLLRAVSGLLPTWKGTILLDGENITRADTVYRVKLGLAHVPEGRHIWPSLTVEENLMLGTYSWGKKSIHNIHVRLNEIYELFPRLYERRRQLAGNLSGGEQQMLALGRAFMQKPRIALLDEPSLGLSPAFVDKIYEALLKWKECGVTLLIVEQRVDTILQIADRGYVLRNGRIVYTGIANSFRDKVLLKELLLMP
jgi:branched-chain amino acid transport system ATP-binding protein